MSKLNVATTLTVMIPRDNENHEIYKRQLINDWLAAFQSEVKPELMKHVTMNDKQYRLSVCISMIGA